jgi:hypothetical protein
MGFLFLFLMFAFAVVAGIYNMNVDKRVTKTAVIKIVIPSIFSILFIIDMFFLFSGGINKMTDLDLIVGLSKNPRAYTQAILKDNDGKIYYASGLVKGNFLPYSIGFSNLRVTYLPCTRIIIKIEQRPEDGYFVPYGPNGTVRTSADGYCELYEYSRDTLPFSIAAIGAILILVLILKIIQSKRNS